MVQRAPTSYEGAITCACKVWPEAGCGWVQSLLGGCRRRAPRRLRAAARAARAWHGAAQSGRHPRRLWERLQQRSLALASSFCKGLGRPVAVLRRRPAPYEASTNGSGRRQAPGHNWRPGAAQPATLRGGLRRSRGPQPARGAIRAAGRAQIASDHDGSRPISLRTRRGPAWPCPSAAGTSRRRPPSCLSPCPSSSSWCR